jgi:YCII-related domain
MERIFAVIRSRGTGWNHSRPMEGQEDWPSHAAFMNALQKEGFVLLGGPLEGTPDVLLIIRATDVEQIRSRLSDDSWTRKDLLRITQVVPWTLRLGSLG